MDNPILRLDGRPLDDKVSQKTIALLALLMMRENKTMRRAELIDILWPDSSEDAGKYNLRFNLWQLRKALGERDDKTLVLGSRADCRINPDYEYVCDIEIVERCRLAEASYSTASGTPGADRINSEDSTASSASTRCAGPYSSASGDLEKSGGDELETVLDMFRRDFLSDYYFRGCSELNDMIVMERYRLENQYLRLMRAYVRRTFEEGNYPKSLAAAEKALEMDPYDEDITYIQLSILLNRGNFSEAGKQYQRFRMKLMADIGVEPSEALKELFRDFTLPDPEHPEPVEFLFTSVSVPQYFWLTDLLRAMYEKDDFRLTDYATQAQLEDFAYMQYRLRHDSTVPTKTAVTTTSATTGRMTKTFAPPIERILDELLTVIDAVCGSGVPVNFSLTPGSEISESLYGITQILAARNGDKFHFKRADAAAGTKDGPMR
ncbi:AfsR/SARP family transcriptional regulator [Hornefia porci]|nr:BTAD domain-containing putative transcriptional regulator [Hornefia porci]